MPGELTLSLSTLYGFLLVLARVAGAVSLIPLPGIRNAPEPARIFLALSVTLALVAQWPQADFSGWGLGGLVSCMLAEAAMGITIGIAVAFLTEALLMAAQISGFQAGYGYASTIDPTSGADSTVLLAIAQLTAGLLFFALGLDREVLRILARSMETYPPGRFVLSARTAEAILRLGTGLFTTGLRLALPSVALLVLVDLALALLGRMNAQLQLLTLAFPVKMLAVLAVLAFVAVLLPRVFSSYAVDTMQAIRVSVGL